MDDYEPLFDTLCVGSSMDRHDITNTRYAPSIFAVPTEILLIRHLEHLINDSYKCPLTISAIANRSHLT